MKVVKTGLNIKFLLVVLALSCKLPSFGQELGSSNLPEPDVNISKVNSKFGLDDSAAKRILRQAIQETDLPRSIELSQKAAKLCQKELLSGVNSDFALLLLCACNRQTGFSYMKLGEFKKAEKYLKISLRNLEGLNASTSVDTSSLWKLQEAASLDCLSITLRKLGNEIEARNALVHSYDLAKEVFMICPDDASYAAMYARMCTQIVQFDGSKSNAQKLELLQFAIGKLKAIKPDSAEVKWATNSMMFLQVDLLKKSKLSRESLDVLEQIIFNYDWILREHPETKSKVNCYLAVAYLRKVQTILDLGETAKISDDLKEIIVNANKALKLDSGDKLAQYAKNKAIMLMEIQEIAK